MDYRIEIEEHATQPMIHTYASGSMTEDERVLMGSDSIQKGRTAHICKFIFDIREAQLTYSLINSHQAVLNLQELGVTKNDFIAVIYFHNADQLEHAKRAAHNRGVYNINFFTDLEAGIEWLAANG